MFVVVKHDYTESPEKEHEVIPVYFETREEANKYFDKYLHDRDLIDHELGDIDGFDTGNDWFELIELKRG